MKPRFSSRTCELLISSGLIVLGLYIVIQTRNIAGLQTYAQVGPRLFPNIVGAALILLGTVLVWQAASGGWRHVPLDQEGHDSPNWRATLIIGAGVLLHMALIGWAGFILAGILLYTLIARAFGSSRLLVNLGVATTLASVVFYLFTKVLGLSLPEGLFGGF
jgi:putative tricarboxylic transport membrane protein